MKHSGSRPSKDTVRKTGTKKITVTPYNPEWPNIYETEANLIKEILGNNIIEIHHVGSTAVPKLSAKPRIDIILAIKDPESAIHQLETIGYEYTGEYNIPFQYGFRKRAENEFNIHAFEKDDPEIELNLLFRDYLRSHPESLKEYSDLKANLLSKESSFVKNNSMFTGYNLGKSEFIKDVLTKAGFNRLRMHYCIHDEELIAAKRFREIYFSKISKPDIYIDTFNNPAHIHLIFYEGVKIIGYAHLAILADKDKAIKDTTIALKIFIIDNLSEKTKLTNHFLNLIEKLVKSKGYKLSFGHAQP